MPVDPISLAVFKNLFAAVADEMGVTLQRASALGTARRAPTDTRYVQSRRNPSPV